MKETFEKYTCNRCGVVIERKIEGELLAYKGWLEVKYSYVPDTKSVPGIVQRKGHFCPQCKKIVVATFIEPTPRTGRISSSWKS